MKQIGINLEIMDKESLDLRFCSIKDFIIECQDKLNKFGKDQSRVENINNSSYN